MSNPYFNKTPLQVVTGATARATDLNNIAAVTELAFDNLLTGGLQVRSANYAVATGSANAYAVTLTPVPAAYTSGMEVVFKANHTNTGAATLNVNSLSPISIKMPNGDAMAAGDIPSGGIIRCWYDGTNFQISGDYSAAVAADALLAAGYAADAENSKNAAIIAQAAAQAAETNAEAAQAAVEAAESSGAWNFSTTTTMADPGSGIIRFNHATLSSVTAIAVDDLNSAAQDFSPYVLTWDDSTDTNKGALIIRQRAGAFAIFTVTGLTDNSGWTQIAVTHVASGGTFLDATLAGVFFSRSGDIPADAVLTSGDQTIAGTKTFSGTVVNKIGTDVASDTSLTLGAGNVFDITGTTTITSIAAKAVGCAVILQFDGALTLTHNATDLILPGGVNITTAAGDIMTAYEYAAGKWRCTNYQAMGTYLDISPVSPITSGVIRCAKSGRIVTLSWDSLGHSAATSVNSACIPAGYRPLVDSQAVTGCGALSITTAWVSTAGAFHLEYRDWAGSGYSGSLSGRGSISYVAAI